MTRSIAQKGTVDSPSAEGDSHCDLGEVRNTSVRVAKRLGLDIHDAEDVAGEVSVGLLTTASRGLEGVENRNAFIWRLTRNGVINRFRKERRRRSAEDAAADPEAPSTSDLEAIMARDEVEWIWAHLSVPERELLTMRFWEGQKLPGIARQLGVQYSTVYQRWYRLRKKLRDLLGLN